MDSWQRYHQHLVRYTDLGFSLDVSQMGFPEGFLESMAEPATAAYADMRELEAGAMKNVDEERMVGHYWLRDASLAPNADIRSYIESCRDDIISFAKEVHAENKFTHVLVVGIGGSALGPQLIADALGNASDAMQIAFLDNTDPDGFARVLGILPLATTMTVVISKSGGTKETANGMAATRAAYEAAGLNFNAHAVAVTGVGSKLDEVAKKDGWRKRFEMTDWVGGRTSVTSVVGLVPMALQGLDITAFLEGARMMDAHTRNEDSSSNAAMLIALMWHHAGEGAGKKDMVILPYKDRLTLMAKYLQQLIMESLGKEHDLNGKVVEQGIAVYGNKGSTDQHAYVQQLRDGVNNFFATFIEVRESFSDGRVEENVAGDYLQGFLRGTRKALAEKGRRSMTLSLPNVNARTVGSLIALFERAVGFYAVLVNINAYHQPGVEAGKKAAEAFMDFMSQSRVHLRASPGQAFTAEQVVPHIKPHGETQEPTVEDVYHGLVHIAHNDPGVTQVTGATPLEDTFQA
jgi:glucose-6-phosphate isomerase